MDLSSFQKWLKISIFNLLLVAGAGVILRYKIAFSLPWVDQKYLLHGHSHFAFAGWITQALLTLLVHYLQQAGLHNAFRKYRWLLYANLITAYGMFTSFPLQGYALVSIIFSTLSIFVSYAFAIIFVRDTNRLGLRSSADLCFKAGVFFNALSSAGVFSLAFMLASRQLNEHLYLASVYFFLHFQYNGWFFFACLGLLNCRLLKTGIDDARLKKIFLFFFIACIPAYLLSTLWLHLPAWIYSIVVGAAISQAYAWIKLILIIKKNIILLKSSIPVFFRFVFILVAIALSIKLSLQGLSVIPSLSTLAFGFRPIVIGYLHLVLLGVISLFIIGCLFAQNYLPSNKMSYTGLFVFITGIIGNEIILMMQGAGGIMYIAVSYADRLLLIAAVLLFTGLLLVNYGLFSSRYASAHNLKR